MENYIYLVFLLNYIVDFLLLISTNHLTGFPQRWLRIMAASLLGATYGAVCMIPSLFFLGNGFWRIVFLLLIGVAAFGISAGAIRRCVLFSLMCMALGGVAWSVDAGGFWEIIALCVVLCLLCYYGFRGRAGGREYVKLTLRHNNQTVKLIALKDTGNTLWDPITGQSVVILSADIARTLVGLTQRQLQNPVETVTQGTVRGLRLMPYKTVGNPGGFLLAKRLEYVKIGNWQGSCLVAFSAEKLDREDSFQALTGGMV